MKRPVLALVLLASVTLACGTYVPTVTLTAQATPEPQEAAPTLRPSPLPPTRTATPAADVAVIRATVYVRSAADAGSAEVGSLETGQTVEIIACDGSWCEIEYMFENETVRGFVFRGCTDNNPDGLKCEVRQ